VHGRRFVVSSEGDAAVEKPLQNMCDMYEGYIDARCCGDHVDTSIRKQGTRACRRTRGFVCMGMVRDAEYHGTSRETSGTATKTAYVDINLKAPCLVAKLITTL
jgi:hypothetical protein